MVSRDSKVHYFANFLFCCWLLQSLVVWPRLGDPFVSQHPIGVCVSHSPGQMLDCAYTICLYSNFLHNYQWITLPTQSCLVLYSFCANLLHSFIMWLMFSSLSQHNLHLQFCCVLSILALIWSVLIGLFWAAIRRDSVSLLRFPFLSLVHVFSCDSVSCNSSSQDQW